jgi:hypothetical protein
MAIQGNSIQFVHGKQALAFLLYLLAWLGSPQVVSAQVAPTVRWDRTYGGNADDDLTSVEPTRDGGYILNGFSRSGSSGDKTQPNPGRSALWIIKVDSAGAKQWDRTFGSASLYDEGAIRAAQTSDGGYLLAGGAYAGASGDKTHPGLGYTDFWVIKLDAQGNKQWDRTLGGSGNDAGTCVALTPDGGYLVGGPSDSGVSGEKTQPALGGSSDYWVVKLTGQGQIQWDRTFGGTGEDQLLALHPTADGGYLLGGASESGPFGDKTQAARGRRDYWVVKTDALGRKEWDTTLGGSGDEWLQALSATSDGGYVLEGFSESSVSGERTHPTQGGSDGWLVKLDGSGRVLWDQVVGGRDNDVIRRVLPQPGSGYLLGLSSASGASGDKSQPSNGLVDYWLVRLKAPQIGGMLCCVPVAKCSCLLLPH